MIRFMPGAVICGITLLAACSSDEDVMPKRKFISFKMDTAVVLSEQSNSAFYSPGNTTDADPSNDHAELLITGYSYGKDVINIRVTTPDSIVTPGTYTNTYPGTSMTMEMSNTLDIITADELYGNLTVTVHQVQDSLAIGQFSGTLVNTTDGSLKTIRDGYFRVIYKRYP